MINKRGQSMALAIMGLIFFAIIGLMSINFLFDEVSTARTELNCADSANISDGSKLLCLIVDIGIPYWIWIILAVSIGFVLVKFRL